MKELYCGNPCAKGPSRTRLYKVDMPDDIDPAVLIALLGIKELQADYEAKDDEW